MSAASKIQLKSMRLTMEGALRLARPAEWQRGVMDLEQGTGVITLPLQVKDLNIEEGGAFTVSSADELLAAVP